MKKIITHDGLFHADEIFAIALLLEIRYTVPIVRTRAITKEEMLDPDVWVLDVGGELNYIKHNFDHHQDSLLKASNMLVLDFLHSQEYISSDLFLLLLDNFNHISSIDKGGFNEYNGFQVNSLIKSLNFVENGFNKALDIARAYIQSCISREKENRISWHIWDIGEDILNEKKVAIAKICNEFPVNWKLYKTHPFLIVPKWNKREESKHLYNDSQQFLVHSIDSDKYPLHEGGNEIFIHKNKFLAIYKTLPEAIECVIKSSKTSFCLHK